MTRTPQELKKAGSESISIPIAAHARDAIALFRAHADLRLLPVLSDRGTPLGAIFERDVRAILFNQYGHALLQNPGSASLLKDKVRPCPTVEVTSDLSAVLTIYATSGGREGIILTRAGRYCGVIENRDLIMAAGAYEQESLRSREVRFNALRDSGRVFDMEIAGLVDRLAELAADVERSATQASQRGQETGSRAMAVASAAEQTGDTMSTIAHHGTNHVDMLGQLRDRTVEAKATAAQAVGLVAASAQRSSDLNQSTEAIERMTQLIEGLAGRVTMLALNATIEAARAGAAGRGFAVVAAEVRDLAGQTRSAAEEIRDHSVRLRSMTAEVLAGNAGIGDVMAGIEEIASSVDAAVEAQGAMTARIAEDVRQAANATRDIHANVRGINESAQSAARGAGEMQGVAEALASSSQQLKGRVETFLDVIRSTA